MPKEKEKKEKGGKKFDKHDLAGVEKKLQQHDFLGGLQPGAEDFELVKQLGGMDISK